MHIRELIDAYLAGGALVRPAVAGLTAEQLDARPVPGKWSVREVVCHLADAELLYAMRLRRVVAEDDPLLPNVEPEAFVAALAYRQRDVGEELAVIESVRRSTGRLLQALSPEQFARAGTHSTAGPLTVTDLLRRVTDHIPHHLKFVKEKRSALGV